MKVEYNFKKFEEPRKGLFLIHKVDGQFLSSEGWENELKEVLIIGEDNTSFIYRLQYSKQDEWVGNKVIAKHFILPIGIHKSRLVKWRTGQLTLFRLDNNEPLVNSN